MSFFLGPLSKSFFGVPLLIFLLSDFSSGNQKLFGEDFQSALIKAEVEFTEFEPGGCDLEYGFNEGNDSDWLYSAEIDEYDLDQGVKFHFSYPVDSMDLSLRYSNVWGIEYSETEGGIYSRKSAKWSEPIQATMIGFCEFNLPSVSPREGSQWVNFTPNLDPIEIEKEIKSEKEYMNEERFTVGIFIDEIELVGTIYRNGKPTIISWRFEIRHGEC